MFFCFIIIYPKSRSHHLSLGITISLLTLISSSAYLMMSSSSVLGSKARSNLLPIDSHLHVWSDGERPYPYFNDNIPPDDLKHCQVEDLLVQQMNARVAGALIVQPINHGYDHSYVLSVIKHSQRMKGMCLMNPTLSKAGELSNSESTLNYFAYFLPILHA